ncbi:AAA family ATPase [Schlegelella sp. ID0723]|uniref:AAA family ATPase n=1 Tax=Piscinibacter koreensis TaxID=2742824 RepID=A0A7Y6TX85_9BURK|nr:AAA family ATPase [Schlegelella koreensis]
MYARFFGLTHEPFSIAPDPRYLFMSKRHREALAHLLYGVGGGGGFVLLSGEIGAGKTTVCRCFLEQIPENTNVAYIFNPKLTVIELLKAVCDEFGVKPEPPTHGEPTATTYVDALNAFLLQAHGAGRNNVLIIDEAQNLSADVLEQLRLLTNLETSERKLLQIILIGQPELRALVARPDLEQLAQRVIARFHLDALTEAETDQYIRHRLAVAGTHANLFDRAAARRIYRLTRGVPRRINLLCDRAMLGAYATGQSRISVGIVDKAAREVFGGADASRAARPFTQRTVALATGGMLLGGAGIVALAAVVLGGDRAASTRGVAASAVAASAASGAASGARSASTAAAGASAASAAASRPAAAASGVERPAPRPAANPTPRRGPASAADTPRRAPPRNSPAPAPRRASAPAPTSAGSAPALPASAAPSSTSALPR